MPSKDNRDGVRGPQQTPPASEPPPNVATSTSSTDITGVPVIHRQASKDPSTKVCVDRATSVKGMLAGKPTPEPGRMNQEPALHPKPSRAPADTGTVGKGRNRSRSRSRASLPVVSAHGDEHHGDRGSHGVNKGKGKQTSKSGCSTPPNPKYHEHGRGDGDGDGARASVPRGRKTSLGVTPVVHPKVAKFAFAICQSMGGPEAPAGLDKRLEERYKRAKKPSGGGP